MNTEKEIRFKDVISIFVEVILLKYFIFRYGEDPKETLPPPFVFWGPLILNRKKQQVQGPRLILRPWAKLCLWIWSREAPIYRKVLGVYVSQTIQELQTKKGIKGKTP